jgi:hypothetical protein
MLHALDAWGVEGSSERAAPTLTRAKLGNAGLVDPLLHGDGMVGLSGLYAVTNAIRLALADRRYITAGEAHVLMSAGFRFLSGRLTPLQVYSCGCRVSVWRGLAQAMVQTACQRLGANLRIERLAVPLGGRGGAFAAIEQAIDAWRPVLILCRGGRYKVVSGYTASSLLLFDSAGAAWLSKRACAVPGDGEGGRHVLYPASFLALSA